MAHLVEPPLAVSSRSLEIGFVEAFDHGHDMSSAFVVFEAAPGDHHLFSARHILVALLKGLHAGVLSLAGRVFVAAHHHFHGSGEDTFPGFAHERVSGFPHSGDASPAALVLGAAFGHILDGCSMFLWVHLPKLGAAQLDHSLGVGKGRVSGSHRDSGEGTSDSEGFHL